MVLGAMLIAGALLLYHMNQKENAAARKAAADVMVQMLPQMEENTAQDALLNIPEALLSEEDLMMDEVEIDGHLYIGYLSIQNLNLELPVMSTWDYDKLNIAPCRYSGSLQGRDLVIMAHNYKSHFESLSQLEAGDSVRFTDVNGRTVQYEVVGKDILDPTDVEGMIAGDFDLTLFTCTYSGESRVTIYCNCITE